FFRRKKSVAPADAAAAHQAAANGAALAAGSGAPGKHGLPAPARVSSVRKLSGHEEHDVGMITYIPDGYHPSAANGDAVMPPELAAVVRDTAQFASSGGGREKLVGARRAARPRR